MFDFLLKKAPTARSIVPPASASSKVDAEQADALQAALRLTVERQRKTDPLIGPKMGAKQVNNSLIRGLRNPKGVHIESYLTALGAVAGFSCQMSLRAAGLATETVLVAASGADGRTYYFGDALNRPLAEDTYSIWSLAAGAAKMLKATPPDVAEIFTHVAGSVGRRDFGVPRLPDDHRPGDTPLNYLKVLWPTLFPVIRPFCDEPAGWPILFALAVQESIFMSRDVLEPGLAVSVVMESAIPMSKVDLPEFYRVE